MNLSLRHYFDENGGALFDYGPKYFTSRARLPDRGMYSALPLTDYETVVTHAPDDNFYALSNRCRHKRSLIIDPKHRGDAPEGHKGVLTCPVHCWAYDLQGKNIQTPKYKKDDLQGHNINLPSKKLTESLGLLWDDYLPTIQKEHLPYLDMSGLTYWCQDVDDYDFNWLVFMDIYFDLYHVGPYHKDTFSQFLDVTNLDWKFGQDYSIQIAPYLTDRDPAHNISAGYDGVRTWMDRMFSKEHYSSQHIGAVWGCIFPNVMIEKYPFMTAVSTIAPLGPNKCRNVIEYFYDDKLPREAAFAQIKAYRETAAEDAEIYATMSSGYYRDFLDGKDERGPNHPFLERGISHYHQWFWNKINHQDFGW